MGSRSYSTGGETADEGVEMAPKRGAARRPAAAGAVIRRPARREEAAEEERPNRPKLQKFSDLDPIAIAELKGINLPDATYYGRKVTLAGKVKTLRSEERQWFLDVEVWGTKDEDLLRLLSGKREKVVSLHVCGAECNQLLTDELLVHAFTFEEVDLSEESWMTNLRLARERPGGEDDLRDLRREQERMEEMDKKAQRADKKEAKKRKRDGGDEGRRAKSPRKNEGALEVGQKDLADIFGGTGMDPDVRARSKVLKKARRIAKKDKRSKKKKEKGSSSGSLVSSSSSSSSSSLEVGETGLFEDEKRLKAVWKRCPGALASRSIQEIKRSLVTAAGTAWEMNKESLPPIYTQYCRQVVMGGMSASLQQEVITISQALDMLALGKVAACMDLLNQRLKSLEALGRGAHWTMCRQYELIKTEEGGMTEVQERLAAARQAREEDRLRSLMSRPSSGKGGDYSQSPGGKSRKGKEKGSGKNQPGDGGKNRGGGGNKEENKPPWPKK